MGILPSRIFFTVYLSKFVHAILPWVIFFFWERLEWFLFLFFLEELYQTPWSVFKIWYSNTSKEYLKTHILMLGWKIKKNTHQIMNKCSWRTCLKRGLLSTISFIYHNPLLKRHVACSKTLYCLFKVRRVRVIKNEPRAPMFSKRTKRKIKQRLCTS